MAEDDRVFIRPPKPIEEMTEQELDEFSRLLADWIKKIAIERALRDKPDGKDDKTE